jgi:hypothetical protein
MILHVSLDKAAINTHVQASAMKKSWRQLLPAWLCCILLPLVPLTFWWRPDDGRSSPMGLFFIGCASLVAYVFRADLISSPVDELERSERLWRGRMTTVGTALFFASSVFSLLWLILIDAHDFVAVFLAFSILIPSWCIVPYLTLLTRKPFAAVLFTLFAVLGAKLLGCVVVVLIYGWHADRHVPPYTDMPWERPNLLVWVFLFNTAVLSAWFYILGERKFQTIHERAGQQTANTFDS